MASAECVACSELFEIDESIQLEKGRLCRSCILQVCMDASKALRRPAPDAGGLAAIFRRLEEARHPAAANPSPRLHGFSRAGEIRAPREVEVKAS